MAIDLSTLALPEGWEAVPTYSPDGSVYVRFNRLYNIPGWWVTVQFDPMAPADGPLDLHVRLDTSEESMNESNWMSGITTGDLRSIPLGDIRREWNALKPRILAWMGQTDTGDPVGRAESERDYAVVARAYVEYVREGHRSPIKRLAQDWSVSSSTVSARIQKARRLGLLAGTPGKRATELTSKAKKLLNDDPKEEA
ncbi:hypothetical protein KGQ19_03720 [Catenulispora sp. NL8]|uniref:Uncharacterized protein n=1 Tax=Catenulispora pinistramenti TaxID=2705254 RepID=A0ABS5KI48_9ACTN|nr:hypothetical protein [Catenulispora pinistramenti]MBS2545969.1 hypothetical protein [Catenulispora pinistramenti]